MLAGSQERTSPSPPPGSVWGRGCYLLPVKIRCPICDTELADVPRDYPHAPFCSVRCKRVDLANWFEERYCLSRPLHVDDLEDEESTLN